MVIFTMFQRTSVAKEDTVKAIATKKPEKAPKEPSSSKPIDDDDDDDDVTMTDHRVTISDTDKPTTTATATTTASTTTTTASTSTATVYKKLPPCPYGKKCYRYIIQCLL